MDYNGYALSAYKEIAELDSSHGVLLVQHIVSKKIYVKKVLEVYSKPVYDYLLMNPVRNMPRILEAIEDNNTLTIIEDYVPGDTLQYILDNQGTFPEDAVLSIAIQLCRIVQDLHGAKPAIVHRDIKPGNIILSEDNIVKLLDMNAAKQYLPEHQNDTRIMGTVGFAAPEQYGFSQSSVKTDIYSIGVVINMLLTGQLPTKTMTSSDLRSIVNRCCEISPRDRYASVTDLIAELEAISQKRMRKSTPRVQEYETNWKRYLPPGFRSSNLSSFVLALLGYGFILALALTLKVENATPKILFMNRLAITTIFIGIIFFTGNYLNIHSRLPLTRSKYLTIRFFGILLYDACIIIAVLAMLAIAMS